MLKHYCGKSERYEQNFKVSDIKCTSVTRIQVKVYHINIYLHVCMCCSLYLDLLSDLILNIFLII